MVKLKLYQETQVQALMRHSRLGKSITASPGLRTKVDTLKFSSSCLTNNSPSDHLVVYVKGPTVKLSCLFSLLIQPSRIPFCPPSCFFSESDVSLPIPLSGTGLALDFCSCTQLHSSVFTLDLYQLLQCLSRDPHLLCYHSPLLLCTSFLSNSTNPHPWPLRNPWHLKPLVA